ncbi:MAG: endonuclease/exonuclease/phosphatase family protein [Pseudobdellovibrionaceae bacterium]
MTWSSEIDLKFCLFNAENLFLLFDKAPAPEFLNFDETQWQTLSTSVYENKPLRKLKEIAMMIQQTKPQIIMLCEVGGPESLNHLNQYFLNSEYSPAIIEGNSDRNIDVGFLVKKNQNFYFDLQTNKNRPIHYLYPHERESLNSSSVKPQHSHKFSRDVSELHLFTKDVNKPFLIILLTHLKSRLDPERIDPQGFERRRAELLTLLEIYKELQTKNPNTPIVVSGDFNGNAGKLNTDSEFEKIYSTTDLMDVLELAQVPQEQRSTYYQIRSPMKTEGRQIDFCFLSNLAQKYFKKNSAHVYRYKDDFGFPIDIPQNMEAKLNLPSDHYPVIFELEKIKI